MNGLYRGLVLLALIIIVVLLLFIYSDKVERSPAPSQVEARMQALVHLKRLSSIDDFAGLHIGNSFAYFKLDGTQSDIYEVELERPGGQASGYIIVNLNKDDFPVLEFAKDGPSLRARLEKKVGHPRFRPVWLTPTFSIAIDEQGNILAKEGNYVRTHKSDSADTPTPDALYQRIIDQRKAFRQRHEKLIHRAWSDMSYGSKTALELVTDYPSGNFFEYLAEGASRAPELQQIPANTGVNTNNYLSGCGATAWAMFIAWHDQMWNPELLRGAQDTNGQDWGPAGDPNTESAWNSYTDRLTMLLADHLETFNDNGEGSVYDDEMRRGIGFIRNRMNQTIAGRDVESDHNDAVQGVYDIMVLDRRPAVISLPGHFAVASGFLFNEDAPTSLDNQWLYINTGWGYHKYIRSVHLDGYWYLKEITTTSRHTYAQQGADGPGLITTRDASGRNTMVWVFWRGTDGKINYMSGSAGALPDPASRVTMDIEAKYTPALTTDGSRIIMAYVDNNDRIKLLLMNPGKDWSPIRFPDIETTVRPAIAGWITDWLTVAFSNSEYGVQMISTNAIDIDAYDAWPQSILGDSYDAGKYWKQLDFLGTDTPISMVRDQSILYVAWNSSSRASDLYFFRVAHKKGDPYYFMSKRLAPGGINLSRVNEDVYLIYRGGSDKLLLEHARTELNDSGEYEIITEAKADLNEASGHLPALTELERENGAHPVTVVGWTGADSKLNLRELSIDTEYHPLNYGSHPDF